MTHIREIERAFIQHYGFVPSVKDLHTFVREEESKGGAKC